MGLFEKIDIKREIDLVRASLITLIASACRTGWTNKKEQRFIELSKKEIELSKNLTA